MAGFGHASTPYRSAANEMLLGAVDPIARQIEIARACAENRAWEMSQGLNHNSTSPMATSPYATNPYVVGFGPQGCFG